MAKDYLGMFNRFFNKGRMSSTYKQVFLRSLLDVGDMNDPERAKRLVGREWLRMENGKLLLDLNFIAIRFAKYYWDMEYSFRLRQSQDPEDANITRLIRRTHDPGKKPPTIQDLSDDGMESFRKAVINKSIKREVLVHRLTDMKGLYKKIDAYTISLEADMVPFLDTHRILLRKGLNNTLTKYLEKLNRMTPQIANKIDSEGIKRTPLKTDFHLLMGRLQDSRCFYCKNRLRRPHVDHVIPYNYVFSTDPYNCTLACQQCNCTKSDMLPNEDLFQDILERNKHDDVLAYFESANSIYSEKSYVRLFESCVEEYNGKAFFSPSA